MLRLGGSNPLAPTKIGETVKAYIKRFLLYQALAFPICYYFAFGLYLLVTSVADNFWIIPSGMAIIIGGPIAAILAFDWKEW